MPYCIMATSDRLKIYPLTPSTRLCLCTILAFYGLVNFPFLFLTQTKGPRVKEVYFFLKRSTEGRKCRAGNPCTIGWPYGLTILLYSIVLSETRVQKLGEIEKKQINHVLFDLVQFTFFFRLAMFGHTSPMCHEGKKLLCNLKLTMGSSDQHKTLSFQGLGLESTSRCGEVEIQPCFVI